MSPTLRFARDEEGYPEAFVETPFEALCQFINVELGDDPIAATMLAETIGSIYSGAEPNYEADGREWLLKVAEGKFQAQEFHRGNLGDTSMDGTTENYNRRQLGRVCFWR